MMVYQTGWEMLLVHGDGEWVGWQCVGGKPVSQLAPYLSWCEARQVVYAKPDGLPEARQSRDGG